MISYTISLPTTKKGVIIDFFLRALRICSLEFLEEELQYVNIYHRLRYPRTFFTYFRCRDLEQTKRGRQTGHDPQHNHSMLGVDRTHGGAGGPHNEDSYHFRQDRKEVRP